MKEKIFRNRESNLEILRIIAVIMIIMHHYALFSGFSLGNQITMNQVVINFFQMFGKLGVCLFIIISGYFYDKTKFKLKKLVSLFLQVFIYSMIGLIIGIVTNSKVLNVVTIIKSFFPVTFGVYWFASCYILLYIFVPFLRKMIENITKKEFKILLTIMIIIWGILANIPMVNLFFNEFIWLMTIYLIGAYIKKYDINILKTNKNRIRWTILIVVILNIIMIEIEVLAIEMPFLRNRIFNFNNINSPLILLLTVILFTIFKNLQVKNSKIINTVASTSFGIYLLHENMFLRDFLWKDLIQGAKFIYSPLLIFNAIGGVLVVFFIGVIVDLVIERLVIQNIVNLLPKIYHYIEKISIFNKAKD